LLVFPWTASIWRQSPSPTGIATVAFKSKPAAEAGHGQIVELLRDLKISPDLHEIFGAIESFAKANPETVKSYRVYPADVQESMKAP
jgi:hypothetical protein